jgi:hypothetical protein
MYVVSELYKTVVRYEIATCRRIVIAVIDLTYDASYEELEGYQYKGRSHETDSLCAVLTRLPSFHKYWPSMSTGEVAVAILASS